MCKIEAEKEREQRQITLKMRQMELEAETARLASGPTVPVCEPSSPAVSSNTFDISRADCLSTFVQRVDLSFGSRNYMSLCPFSCEYCFVIDIDSYFCVFERLAVALKWPEEVWSLLLQCKLNW